MSNLINRMVDNAGKPAPKWYRKFKKIFSNLENFVLTYLMITGTTADAPILLIIKLSTSTLLTNLDTLLVNGEEYYHNVPGVPIPPPENHKE